MGVIEIIALVAIIILFIVALVILFDRGFFKRKVERARPGMTGAQIQDECKLKIRPVEVVDDGYVAVVYSTTRMFKYKFIFENGVLLRKLPY